MATSSATVHFDTALAANQALLIVLLDARETDRKYRFGGLSAKQILSSGLLLEGDITDVLPKVEAVSGAVIHTD